MAEDTAQTKRRVSAEGAKKIRLAGLKIWLDSASKKHGEKFDYAEALSIFSRQKEPDVPITCRKHNVRFEASPYNHIRFDSGGCALCENDIRVSYFREREEKKFETFLRSKRKSLRIMSAFNGMTNPAEFECLKHLEQFTTLPSTITTTAIIGCPACREMRKLDRMSDRRKSFAERLKLNLPENIAAADLVEDRAGSGSLRIECRVHGLSKVTLAQAKKSKHICVSCGYENIGYASTKLSKLVASGSLGQTVNLGVMRIVIDDIESLKVGVSTRPLTVRYASDLKEIYFSVQLPEAYGYVIENRVHRSFREHHDIRVFKRGLRLGKRWSGDTELYFMKQKDRIVDFIKNELEAIKNVNLESELPLFEVVNFYPTDVSRPKDLTNLPREIVGVDPATGKIIHKFPSISAATRAGFKNISMVLLGHRDYAGGLRWFRSTDYGTNNLPPLEARPNKTIRKVRCVDTNEVFDSITLAGSTLRDRGVLISSSHITSVCRGKRSMAGGYRWEYV